MTNKIVAITGLSGSGKTTLAERLSSEQNYTPVFVGNIMRSLAEKEGLNSLTAFVNKNGIREAFQKARGPIFDQIMGSYAKSNVVIDGAYDNGLIEMVEKKVGKENVIVVFIEPGFKERLHRYSASKTGGEEKLAKFLRRDVIKLYVGAGKIIDKAQIRLNGESPDSTFKQLEEKISELIRA